MHKKTDVRQKDRGVQRAAASHDHEDRFPIFLILYFGVTIAAGVVGRLLLAASGTETAIGLPGAIVIPALLSWGMYRRHHWVWILAILIAFSLLPLAALNRGALGFVQLSAGVAQLAILFSPQARAWIRHGATVSRASS